MRTRVASIVVLAAAGMMLSACGGGPQDGEPLPIDSNEPKIEQDVNRAVVKAAFDQWAAGTGTPFDMLAPNATWTITGDSPRFSKTYYGKEQFMSEVIRPFNARMISPLVPSLQWIDSKGDTVTVRFFGTAIARDHIKYENIYLWQLRIRDEQIVEAVATFNLKALEELWDRVQPAP